MSLDEPPLSWKAVSVGIWAAAVLGAAAMWATLHAAARLHRTQPVRQPARATTRTPVPRSIPS